MWGPNGGWNRKPLEKIQRGARLGGEPAMGNYTGSSRLSQLQACMRIGTGSGPGQEVGLAGILRGLRARWKHPSAVLENSVKGPA